MARAINYDASPTAAKLHSSEKVVRGIRGPVGSGKSVACINELHRLAVMQWPNVDGIRKTRWAIIRNTSPELRTTTLKTFRQWIPEEYCPVTMHPVISGVLQYPVGDGTTVEAEFLFLALDQEKDVRKLLSLELTGVFINEAREISFSVVKAARERIGRYPSAIDGYQDDPNRGFKAPESPCRRKALVMDTNPPDDDHWWYQLAENGCLDSTEPMQREFAQAETERVFEFFASPPPLRRDKDGQYIPTDNAENIKYLPGGYQYYLDMIAGNTEDHINVMVLGNYGAIRDGKPVYPEYNDNTHAADVKPIKGLPIALGWDFGLTPSVVIGQLTSTGQLRIIDELVGVDTGVRQFARDIVKPHLATKYRGFQIAFSLGDPSGAAGGEGEGTSAIGILNDDFIREAEEYGNIIQPLRMGFITEPAPTNDPTKRIEAVKSFLIKMIDGQPGYLLDRRCKYLRKGKQGKYQYKRIQVSGEARYHEKPNKNDYSHPADAEQYLALGFLEGYAIDHGDDLYDEYDEHDAGRSAVCGY